MTEDDLIAAVGAACDEHGLWWAHFTVVYRGRRELHGCYGFPDLVITGRLGVLFRECKSRDGLLRREQRAWGRILRAAGADWDVWRPADMASGRIAAELSALS